MSMEFAHTVLHRQNALNRPAIPQKEPPKPAAAPVKEVAKVSPLPSNNKVVNYHYQQRAHPQEDHDKKVQDYYDKLREQAKPPIIPKREHRHKPPEPLVVVHKPAEKKVSKNPSVDALIEKPPQKLLPKHIEEKPRPVSRHAIEEKPKPKVQPPKPKPPPNFYVPDYKPFRYEDSVKNVAMVVPADKKQDKKPSVSAERKKKLAELKEKARKEEKEKEDQLKEKKKREEEINERMKKREEDRIKMRAEIQRLKKKNRESSGGVGFCLVQKAINGEEGEVVEIKGKDGLVDLKEDKVPVKQEEFVVYKPEPSPEKRPDPYPIPEEVEEKREDVKGLEEIGRETAKFANAELAVKLPEKEKVPDSKVTSKSIRRQVEYLTKSLISRQKAKFKEEEQLEQDMLKLANEYKELLKEMPDEEKKESPAAVLVPSEEEEDREDIPELTKASDEEEPVTFSQFESIESILFYLGSEFGDETFLQIYRIIQAVDDELKGEINIDEYERRLKGLMDINQIQRSLFLFLVLKKMEEQAIETQYC